MQKQPCGVDPEDTHAWDPSQGNAVLCLTIRGVNRMLYWWQPSSEDQGGQRGFEVPGRVWPAGPPMGLE